MSGWLDEWQTETLLDLIVNEMSLERRCDTFCQPETLKTSHCTEYEM